MSDPKAVGWGRLKVMYTEVHITVANKKQVNGSKSNQRNCLSLRRERS
jgi:hypothetical protein